MKKYLYSIKAIVDQWHDGLIPDQEAVTKILAQMYMMGVDFVKGEIKE